MAGRTRLAIGVRCFMASIGNVMLLVSEAKAKYMLLLISPGTNCYSSLRFCQLFSASRPSVSHRLWLPPPRHQGNRCFPLAHWCLAGGFLKPHPNFLSCLHAQSPDPLCEGQQCSGVTQRNACSRSASASDWLDPLGWTILPLSLRADRLLAMLSRRQYFVRLMQRIHRRASLHRKSLLLFAAAPSNQLTSGTRSRCVGPGPKSSPLELLDRASRYEVWWSRGPSKSTRQSELVALKHVMVRSLLGTCSHSGDIPGTCRELMRIKLVSWRKQ